MRETFLDLLKDWCFSVGSLFSIDSLAVVFVVAWQYAEWYPELKYISLMCTKCFYGKILCTQTYTQFPNKVYFSRWKQLCCGETTAFMTFYMYVCMHVINKSKVSRLPSTVVASLTLVLFIFSFLFAPHRFIAATGKTFEINDWLKWATKLKSPWHNTQTKLFFSLFLQSLEAHCRRNNKLPL